MLDSRAIVGVPMWTQGCPVHLKKAYGEMIESTGYVEPSTPFLYKHQSLPTTLEQVAVGVEKIFFERKK